MDILQMSFSASILILFIIIMRFFFKNSIPNYIFHLLWGIASCKLIIPFSIFNMIQNVLVKETQQKVSFQIANQIAEKIDLFEIPAIYYVKYSVFTSYHFKVIWLLGMALLTLYFLFVYIHCIRIFKMALPVENTLLQRIWKNKNHFYRNVNILISDRIDSPLTYGILNPVILLPKKANLKEKEICFILEHEMAHIKRFDSFWKLCLIIILICHWFNPLVWYMYFLVNRDIELACDENVIKKMGIEQRTFYANFIVEWETKNFNPFVSNLSQNFIEERIVHIMKMKKISATAVVLSLSLVAGTSTIYAVTPSEPLIETAAKNSIEIGEDDPTLGGIFELYTPEEYAAVIENIKKYSDDDKLAEDIKAMEQDLQRLKADNGKGEFVIYKGAFRFDKTLENGSVVAVGLNPTIIMAPELVERDTPLTIESYKNDIEDISYALDTAIKNGTATLEQKQIILNKMNQNLLKLK